MPKCVVIIKCYLPSLLCPVLLEVAGLVPEWLQLPLITGRLSPDVLDVLLLQRLGLSCPVDHADMPSANLTSRPLRQVMYGLLLGRGSTVDEMDRDGLELKVTPVHPAFPGFTKQLVLRSLHKVRFYPNCQKCIVIFCI